MTFKVCPLSQIAISFYSESPDYEKVRRYSYCFPSRCNNINWKNYKCIIVAVVICIIISCLSPFIASGDPDGLEKSAEDANVPEGVESAVFESPFPDYTFEPLESIGEVGVLILGALLTLICGYGVAEIVKRRS